MAHSIAIPFSACCSPRPWAWSAAIRPARVGKGARFIRFLGRVYSDTSPFIQEYLEVHYQPVFQRFFEAFALALPDLPRNELGVRLQFALKAISGVMAGTELRLLMNSISLGRPATDAEVMAKLITLVSAAIRVPQQSPGSGNRVGEGAGYPACHS